MPLRIFDHFATRDETGAFARLKRHARFYKTVSEDEGHLSPWITWPTVHRGVTNRAHNISDFGMDLAAVDREYPPLWRVLMDHGATLGLVGSLHSHPLPSDLGQVKFYIPDTFAASPECFPSKYQAFQDFNLKMTQRSGRVVSSGIAWKEAVRFGARLPVLGVRARSVGGLASQLVSERLDRRRVVRRRTSQAMITFDIFYRALLKERPDISFFFTNHVASAMHRYWPGLFPEDYPDASFTAARLESWAGEIPFAIVEAQRELGDVMRFVDANPEFRLIVATSMGQAAVEAKKASREVIITDLTALISYFGVPRSEWERRPAMVPQYNFWISDAYRDSILANLASVKVNERVLKATHLGEGVVRVDLGQYNEEKAEVLVGNERVDSRKLGIENIRLPDAAGSNAYHIPEGMLLIYEGPSERAAAPVEDAP
ncbi:MAG: hypothetical protein MI723_19705, partial [Caulobacterales bacterium]|nr:hypothetical protein [Caulobacterales bacterium]